MKWFILILLSSLLAISCDSEPKKSADESHQIDGGKASHQYMVHLLDSLGRTADPRFNYHLNEARAQHFGRQANRAQSHQEKVSLKFQQAVQLMYAAKTEEAIAILENLINEVGVSLRAIPENLKLLFDVLGLAYLRHGELENCIVNHTSASCIVPLQPAAFHELTHGSENAVRIFSAILDQYPNDDQTRYLLNVAYMTLGQYPDQVPASYRLPSQMFEPPKDFPYFQNIAVELGIDQNGIAGGVVVEDFNKDGLLDIMVSSYMYGHPVKLFINQGKKGFTDQSKVANLEGITGGLNMHQTDYNNDGWMDVFILRGGWLGKGGKLPNSLLRNNGDGTFTDVTRQSGLMTLNPTQTACWADFNNDGWLDVFIGNESGKFNDERGDAGIAPSRESHPCQLFINQQDGSFKEEAGSWNANVVGFVKGVTAGDFNNDGWMDIYVSQLKGSNLLLHNTGKRKFKNVAPEAGVEAPHASFPCMFWDYNNDGWTDLFVSGYDVNNMNGVAAAYMKEMEGQHQVSSLPKLYRNNGDGTFDDVTTKAGISKSLYAMGLNFGDLDQDGLLDFYAGTGTPNLSSIVPNRMFKNTGRGAFKEVTHAGFGHIQKGHGIGFGDFDNDGDQDIYTVLGGAYQGDYAQNALFQNPGNNNKWVTLHLEGTESNKAAIGTRVQLELEMKSGATRSIHRTVTSGASFGANPISLNIGLGDALSIRKCEIKWAGQKNKISLGGLPMNRHHFIIQEKESAYKTEEPHAFQFSLNNANGKHH